MLTLIKNNEKYVNSYNKTMKNMLTLIKNNEKYVKCYTKTMKK